MHMPDPGDPPPGVVNCSSEWKTLGFRRQFRRSPYSASTLERQTVMFRPKHLLPLTITVSLLAAACGGGGGGNAPSTPPQMSSGRGQLIKSPPSRLSSLTASELLSTLSSSTQGQVVLQFALAPTCSVDTYYLEYQTVGARGEATTASAALMIPTGSDPICQAPHPIVLYAHGKRVSKAFNIADLANQSWEGLALAAVSSARGYIMVAPNYAGYDTSNLSYHPYLNADQQSGDMIDALTAAHSGLSAMNVADNHKLFVTGYSQVAMATHRALQESRYHGDGLCADQIIGEAANKVRTADPEFAAQHPQVSVGCNVWDAQPGDPRLLRSRPGGSLANGSAGLAGIAESDVSAPQRHRQDAWHFELID